jgi:hypothetical protein
MNMSAAVAWEALAALPPCGEAHSVLDFTGTENVFPPLLHRHYPHCRISVHVDSAQRAAALQVVYDTTDRVGHTFGHHLGTARGAHHRLPGWPPRFVRVLPRLHVAMRSFELHDFSGDGNHGRGGGDPLREPANIDADAEEEWLSTTAPPQSSSSSSAPPKKQASRQAYFHRIIATPDMWRQLHADDRTVHNFCAGLLASLAAGGVCVLVHDATARGVVVFDGGGGNESGGDVEIDADDGAVFHGRDATLSTAWMLALEAVGFTSVEVCFQRGHSFVLGARAPSHASWDAWLTRPTDACVSVLFGLPGVAARPTRGHTTRMCAFLVLTPNAVIVRCSVPARCC